MRGSPGDRRKVCKRLTTVTFTVTESFRFVATSVREAKPKSNTITVARRLAVRVMRPAFYWGYGHFAVYAGIAAFGVGIQLAIEAAAPEYALAAGASLPEGYGLGARAVLAGGVGLFLLGIAFVDRVNEGTTNDRVLLARLSAVMLLVPVAALGSLLSPLAFTATVSLVLLALTVYETLSADPQAGSSAS